MEKRNKETRKAVLLLAAAGMILYSLYQLYDTFIPYVSGNHQYNELQELARESEQEREGQNEESWEQAPEQEKGSDKEKGRTGTEVNFEPLQKINSDIAAWITFEEPSKIDYPVVQGKDNQEYLTRTFDEDGHKYGTIFMDVDNSSDFSDRNTFIYGHHMANGSMFAGLLDYLDAAYYKAHPYFTIYTVDDRTLTYQVCSVEITAEGTLSYQWMYDREESWEEYCTYIMNNARYQTGVTLYADSKLVSLSTCLNTTSNQRVLLHGILIGEM